jgi:DNA-binding transcriptional ArsR family regulator
LGLSPDLVEETARQLKELGDAIVYAHKGWQQHGRWNRYYQVPAGSIHTTITCRTINAQTRLRILPHLSGLPLEEMANACKLCRHCGSKPTGMVPDPLSEQGLRRRRLIA